MNVWLKQYCLCARCGRAVYVDGLTPYVPEEKRLIGIVHHKEYLTEENVMDDNIALNEDNLEGLCIDCHNREHKSSDVIRKDLYFDEKGNVVKK